MNFSFDNKRYHTLNYDLTTRFNTRVVKVSLNGGFSCPNIKNGHGCIFCSSMGSGDFAGNKEDDLVTQFNNVKEKLSSKWQGTKYIAYFQANTNTYAPVNELKKKFEKAIKIPKVVGLSIGTRPDAISNECLEYLEDLNQRTYLTIELGLQSMHDKTLKLINRGHDLKCFDDCVKRLRKRKINVVVHIINGLPDETKEMMLDTVRHINTLDVQGIKIHMLHVLRNTPLESYYKKNNFHLLSKEEYVDIVCCQLETLNENIVIHRLTGDGAESELIAPSWTKKKVSVLNDIDKELKRRGTYQGFNRSILNRVRLICEKLIKQTDITVDATCGNGNDTLMLAKLSNQVFAFDIQKKAVDKTRKLLNSNGVKNVKLICDGHEKIGEYLNEYTGKISLITFNLGYLPGGNKKLTTNTKTTLKAIKQSLALLNKKGVILVTCYPHKEGKKESDAIISFLNENNVNYNVYHNTNKQDTPFLIEIKNSSSR